MQSKQNLKIKRLNHFINTLFKTKMFLKMSAEENV